MEEQEITKTNKQQKFVQAFCPICDCLTVFVSHADFPDKFICTNVECFGYTTSKLKNKELMENVRNPYTGLFGIRKKGIKISKIRSEE